MKKIDPKYAPNRSPDVVLNKHGLDSFEKFPKDIGRPSDAEFRALALLYADFIDHRSQALAERGVSRRSLKTHVIMLDNMKHKKWIGLRGPQDTAVYLTAKGSLVYEFAYYYYSLKEERRFRPTEDDRFEREAIYRKAMPKELVRLLDNYPDLDAVKVYRVYRRVGKSATIELYEELKNGDA